MTSQPSATTSSAHSRLGLVALLAATSMLLSGCFLRSLVGFTGEDGRTSLSADVSVAFCVGPVDETLCLYEILDSDGEVVDVTSTVALQGLGFLGLLIDPLVVQVPQDTSNVVASYNNAGVDEAMDVTETTSFDVTPSRSVASEPGTKFLIVELPPAVAATITGTPVDFNFSIGFDVADPNALEVKPMLTGRVDFEGSPYYVPLAPCVTDFAQVPTMQIPVGSFFEDLRPQVLDIVASPAQLGCDGTVYDFTTGTPTTTAPTTTIPTTTIAPTTIAPTTTAAPTTLPAPATTVAPPAPSDGGAASTTTVPLATSLPETGTSSTTQIWAALTLVLGGIAAVLGSRRRRWS